MANGRRGSAIIIARLLVLMAKCSLDLDWQPRRIQQVVKCALINPVTKVSEGFIAEEMFSVPIGV